AAGRPHVRAGPGLYRSQAPAARHRAGRLGRAEGEARQEEDRDRQADEGQGRPEGRRVVCRRAARRRRRAEAEAEEARGQACDDAADLAGEMSAPSAAPGPAEPIPLTVLTGFLGAGKTSLLNRLIADPALAETAVIINEFGEVGLDHLLVRPIRDGVVLLQSGCLCCTLRGDLVDALEQLLRDLDNGRAVFRRVILETT